jgi:SRSO17 transposase
MGRAMQDLDVWLEPFLAALGHKKGRFWAPLYLRGLLGPSERKSLQPMAASLGLPGHDQFRHFIASPPGTMGRCGGCWPNRPTGWWAGRRRHW